MALDQSSRYALEKDMAKHMGHKLIMASYGSGAGTSYAIECETCNEVLLSSEDYYEDSALEE